MKRKYWDEKNECVHPAERRAYQVGYLNSTFKQAYGHVPFYRKKFDAIGLKPPCGLEVLHEFFAKGLPFFTIKTDLRDNYPFGFCAVPLKKLVRIHASSGTTGKPTLGFYTKKDMRNWAECMARGLWAAGIRPDDIAQNAYGMGLFTGGLGFLFGADRLGCAVIPSGPGMTDRQIMLMQDLGTTVLFCTPSYALTIHEKYEQLAEKAKQEGKNFKKLRLRVGVFGAEPWSDKIRQEIEKRLSLVAHEAYGLTEMMGPGVAFSCQTGALHINEDHVFPEIINPETGIVLPDGVEGELVLTSLQREAMPLIRYRTRDVTALCRGRCDCGRTLATMKRIMRRSDDMKKIDGIIMYPSQIESILMEFPEVAPFYEIHLRKCGYRDEMTVVVETKESFDDKKNAELERKIADRIKNLTVINTGVRVVPPDSLPRSEGKAKRLIDEREEK